MLKFLNDVNAVKTVTRFGDNVFINVYLENIRFKISGCQTIMEYILDLDTR